MAGRMAVSLIATGFAALLGAPCARAEESVPAPPSCEWLTAHWLCTEKSTSAERHLVVQSLDETSIRVAIYDGDEAPDESSDDWETHKYTNEYVTIRPLVKEKMVCGADSSLTIGRKLSFAATATFVYRKSPNQADVMTFSHTVTAVGEPGFTELTTCRKLP